MPNPSIPPHRKGCSTPCRFLHEIRRSQQSWPVQKCSPDAGRGGDVGRRRQLGRGGDAGRGGLRRRRRDAPALRPWRGAGAEGRVLRRARHPRCAAGRGDDGLSPLRARLREPLPRERDRRFRRRLPRRARRRCPASAATSGSSSATCSRPRATSTPTAWRPAITSAGSTGRTGRSCTAPPTRPRPELFPVLDHAGAARLPALPARRAASKAETRALAARYGLPVADKPDSQDICFVPNGSYAAVIEKLRPGRGRARRHRRPRRPRARAPRRRHPLHRRPAARARHRRRRAALRRAPRRRPPGGSSSARARRSRGARCRWRR